MIDIGANLTNASFAQDLVQVLDRARAHGVEKIIVTGTNVLASQAAKSLADLHPDYLYATAGLHPHEADSFEPDFIGSFKELLEADNVLAVGETGLDFNRNYSCTENQIYAFETHLQLATEINKPLFLHERDAHKTFYEIMHAHQPLCEKAIVHCFTGDLTALRNYLDLGLHIGITGWICDKKRGAELRQIIQYAPLDRLMIESDAPYLMPHKEMLRNEMSHKHRNEPWTLKYCVRELAKALNIDEQQLTQMTTDNARRFFAINSLDH